MSSRPVTALPPVTGNAVLNSHACAPVRGRDNHQDPVTPGNAVTLLRHCRCCDCRRFFHDAAGQPFCEAHIGGTQVNFNTGERFCSPRPDQWHYCARYDGPAISRDVWVWPKPALAVEVGAGSKTPADSAEGSTAGEERDRAERRSNGSFAGSQPEPRGGNSQTPRFCLSPAANTPANPDPSTLSRRS